MTGLSVLPRDWGLLHHGDAALITAGTLMYEGIRTPRPPKPQSATLQPSLDASPSA